MFFGDFVLVELTGCLAQPLLFLCMALSEESYPANFHCDRDVWDGAQGELSWQSLMPPCHTPFVGNQ
jgi:hypothetical protein